MSRYLMDLCFKYEQRKCSVDEVKNARVPGEAKENRMPMFPSGEEQERLDQVCEKCDARMFKINSPVCPVCQGGIGPASMSGGNVDSWKIYQYRCLHCNSLLYSHKKIV